MKEWFKKTYEYCNFDIDMCTDLSKIKSLDEYTGVFIGGGNTFKLLKEIRESKFDILLEKYLKNGGFVYGGSAGAASVLEGSDRAGAGNGAAQCGDAPL